MHVTLVKEGLKRRFRQHRKYADQLVQNAIEKGVAKAAADSPGDKSAAISGAITNVAVMLQDSIAGRIALEVDPRLADDAGAPNYRPVETRG